MGKGRRVSIAAGETAGSAGSWPPPRRGGRRKSRPRGREARRGGVPRASGARPPRRGRARNDPGPRRAGARCAAAAGDGPRPVNQEHRCRGLRDRPQRVGVLRVEPGQRRRGVGHRPHERWLGDEGPPPSTTGDNPAPRRGACRRARTPRSPSLAGRLPPTGSRPPRRTRCPTRRPARRPAPALRTRRGVGAMSCDSCTP